MAHDIADQPPLTALYDELHSALVSAAALHRLIAAHPDCGARAPHQLAAAYAESEMERFGYQRPEDKPYAS